MSDTKDESKIEISIEEYNSLKAVRSEAETLRSKLAEQQTRLTTLSAEHEELKTKKAPKDAPKREDIEAEVRREFGEKLQSVEQSKAALEKRLRDLTVTDRVMSAIQDRVVPSARKWLRQEIEKECDIEGDLSSPTIVVKDEQGNIRWSSKRPDQKMNVDEYTEVLQTRYPEFFKSAARAGESNANTQKTTMSHTEASALTFDDLANMSNEELAKVPVHQMDKILNNTVIR